MKKFSREDIEKKVNEIIVDKTGVEKSVVKADAQLDETLGMDSLDALDVEMELVKEFSISVPDDVAVKKEWNVGQVYDFVEQLIK